MSGIKVFWMEPTDLVRVRLRVYRITGETPCGKGCKDTSVGLHESAPRTAWIEDLPDGCHRDRTELVPADDARWPTACAHCGVPFVGDDVVRQLWAEQLYRGSPDGQIYTVRDFPPGAMWNADWLADHPAFTGPDGLSLHVVLPNRSTWCVDSQCSNCTRPQGVPVPDKPGCTHFERTHYCWVRHGDPRTGDVHVDKNGNTCAAGAGSIISGNWHGFLHNGHLVPC